MGERLNPSLGDLAKLPLELRYMLYELLDEDFCCHVAEPLSLFHSYRHDPCVPLGVSRVSKTIWGEVQHLSYQNSRRDLRIRIAYDGWKSSCHPTGFRSDWTSPSLSSFQRLLLEISAPPEDDPGQAILTIRNIANFVSVLNAAPALPPTVISFVDAPDSPASSWNSNRFHHHFDYLQSPFDAPFHTSDYPVTNPLYYLTACALLPLQRPPSSTIQLPPYLFQRDATNPLLTHWPVFPAPYFSDLTSPRGPSSAPPSPTRLHLLTLINAVMLSKTLDDLAGPAAARLRASRRRNWPAYAAWLAAVRAQLQHCRAGVAFLATDLEIGYSWRAEVGGMDDRARRRCEEGRDADWWAEKRWLAEDEGPRGALVTGACECAACRSVCGFGSVQYDDAEMAAERRLRSGERSWWKEKGE